MERSARTPRNTAKLFRPEFLCALLLGCCVNVVWGQGYAGVLPPPLPPAGTGVSGGGYATPGYPVQSYDSQFYGTPSAPAPSVPSVDMESLMKDLPENSYIVDGSIKTEGGEPLPLAAEKASWYRTYPWLWLPRDGWTNSIEFGLNGSDGNSQTTSIQTGADLQRVTKTYTFSVDIDYQKTQASGSETQNNGRMNTSFDRLIGESNWSTFAKLGLEYDEFKAFNLRVNLNAGLGYYWVRNDKTTLVTRFGAGASREIGGPADEWVPEAVFAYEASHQLTARQKIKGQLEYFPQWDDFDSYRIVSDVSWEILLDGIDNLSLKLAATDRYDSTPQGLDPNDIFYSALLIWKF